MWALKNWKGNLKINFYCADLDNDKNYFFLFAHCLMADWANQNQVIGIFIKKGFRGIYYPRPVGLVHVKCNM